MAISKTAFGRFSLADLDGSYLLRRDRVLGAFRIDTSVVETFDDNSAEHLRTEIALDSQVGDSLSKSYRIRKSKNKRRIVSFFQDLAQAEILNQERGGSETSRPNIRRIINLSSILPFNISGSSGSSHSNSGDTENVSYGHDDFTQQDNNGDDHTRVNIDDGGGYVDDAIEMTRFHVETVNQGGEFNNDISDDVSVISDLSSPSNLQAPYLSSPLPPLPSSHHQG
jgi:hypothetical protein